MKKQSLICEILPKSIRYEIEIKNGLLQSIDTLYNFLKPLATRFALVTDFNVAKCHGEALRNALADKGLEIQIFRFRAVEKQKSRQLKSRIEDQMLKAGFGRDSCLIAMGGGIVTDLGGFIAATYCRGIPLIVIPTSLLGMVDAAIGGKNGVNTYEGKNLIGSLYQPKQIWIDPSVLSTMPKQSLPDGFVEMIKHGLIADKGYFEFMEQNVEKLIGLDAEILQEAIYRSCDIKKTIITADERESGKRRLLNFGHTIGHALEKLSHFQLSHGQAVAIGLVVESGLFLPQNDIKRIHELLVQYGHSFKIPVEITVENLLVTMAMDKKATKGVPRLPALQNIGCSIEYDGQFCAAVPKDKLIKALEWMIHDLCRH